MSPPDQISFFGASISFVDRRPNWDLMHRRLGHCFCVDRFGLQQIDLLRRPLTLGVAIRVTAGMAFSQPILIAAERTGRKARALCCVRALSGCGLEVQSKVSGEVILISRRIRPSAARRGRLFEGAHNGLVGGSNPSSPTTQSNTNRDFQVSCK
jgi:hypothetical protein